MVVVCTTGPAALALIGNPAAVQLGVAATVSEAALTTAVAAEAAGVAVAAETALGVVAAAEGAATAASAIAATNIWNPVGWALGAVVFGASQHISQAVTWGCYKPIIEEIDTGDTSIKPMLFAELVAHPKVHRVFIHANAGPAHLPDIEIENQAGNLFLLRGVALPWGSVAYHAERADGPISTLMSTTLG